MTNNITHFISSKGMQTIPLLITIAASAPVIYSFSGLRFEQILFLLILPFTLTVKKKNSYLTFYISSAILFYLIYFLAHIYTSFYLAMCFTIFAMLPTIGYSPSRLSVLLAFTTAPTVKYLLSIFSFPVRLQLSKIAGVILSYIYNEIEVAGNCIYKCNSEFSVAEECLGLNMLTTGLAFSIFALAYFSKKYRKTPGYLFSIIISITTFILIALSNISRIVLTVIFEALPNTLLHEFIGIAVLVINVFIPLIIILSFSKQFFKTHYNKQIKTLIKANKLVFILPILTLSSNLIESNSLKPEINSTSIQIDGYKKSISKDGVLKFENGDHLIYIKPPSFTLGSDHSPFICWKGSGYKIKNESYINIDNHVALSFELIKNNDHLYSVWWYSNGETNTISQLNWRLATIKGEAPFYLINITGTSKESVLKASKDFFK